MANAKLKVGGNVEGEFFVDTTCIDCDTCRKLAGATFADNGEHSYVQRQPQGSLERREALRALVACPTGSIGIDPEDSPPEPRASVRDAIRDFPLAIAGGVSYCGFASADSFGASSYFIEHPTGNWLVDSPRFNRHLERRFEEKGGIATIFLTHRDDVADAARWAERFGAERVIHRADLDAEPVAERVIDGRDPVPLGRDFLAIPTPGHTEGHAVLLYRQKVLFSGDHLWWSRKRKRLWASREACWHDWGAQTESMERLLAHRFEWILPGHGDRIRLPEEEMARELSRLVEAMRSRKESP
jgi:glyoxylase-like metal-dependent hydrolase (beta-lactamase superfamily II)/ferredoxin